MFFVDAPALEVTICSVVVFLLIRHFLLRMEGIRNRLLMNKAKIYQSLFCFFIAIPAKRLKTKILKTYFFS